MTEETRTLLSRKLVALVFMIGAVRLLKANGHGHDWSLTENAAYICVAVAGRLWMTW